MQFVGYVTHAKDLQKSVTGIVGGGVTAGICVFNRSWSKKHGTAPVPIFISILHEKHVPVYVTFTSPVYVYSCILCIDILIATDFLWCPFVVRT